MAISSKSTKCIFKERNSGDMKIVRNTISDSLGNNHPTQTYDIVGSGTVDRKVRIRFIQHKAPHLYLIDKNINAKTSEGKPNWELRPDMDTYEFETKKFNFLIPSYAQYAVTDKVTGKKSYKVVSGAKGGRAFLTSKEGIKSALSDFKDNFKIWKRRNILRKDLKYNTLATHVTECIIYDEKEWQRDPPKFVSKDVEGVQKRVMLDAGTRPQPIARGISACATGDAYVRKKGNLRALGRAFQHYKHKFFTDLSSMDNETREKLEEISRDLKEKFQDKSQQELLDLLGALGS